MHPRGRPLALSRSEKRSELVEPEKWHYSSQAREHRKRSSFQSSGFTRGQSCSLEIWLKPSRVDSGGMILAFYWPESRIVTFALRQFRSGLVIESRDQDKKAEMYVGDILTTQKPVLVTITSGQAATAIYVDGTLVKRAQYFGFSSRQLTGQFVVGGAPDKAYNWSGQVRGLAVYEDRKSTRLNSSYLV